MAVPQDAGAGRMLVRALTTVGSTHAKDSREAGGLGDDGRRAALRVTDVWAQRPPPVSPFDGAPAAPEPCLIAMLASGLGVVGGYVAYRVRKNKPK